MTSPKQTFSVAYISTFDSTSQQYQEWEPQNSWSIPPMIWITTDKAIPFWWSNTNTAFDQLVSIPSCTVMVYWGVVDGNHVGEHCFKKYALRQWSNCRDTLWVWWTWKCRKLLEDSWISGREKRSSSISFSSVQFQKLNVRRWTYAFPTDLHWTTFFPTRW